MSDRVVIPEYPIPKELQNILDTKIYSVARVGSCEESQKYMNILEALKTAKCLDISENHYLQLLKLALYLEEHQNNEEMKKYELVKKTIERVKNPQLNKKLALFNVKVDDLDEERPWIRPNDLVDLTDMYDKKVYTLRVTNVTQTEIVANDDDGRLRDIHKDDKLYDIKFRFQNYPLRCAHYALKLMSQRTTVTYLFPQENKSYIQNQENYSYSAFETINPNIANNPEQEQAILNIVNRSSFPAPYILYGPPGTGKTATLVEAMCQIHKNSSNNILVCTPSNTAGDEITRRLLEFLPPDSIYRMYSQSKKGSTIDEQIQLCSNVDKDTVVLPNSRDVVKKRIVISTLCNSTRLIIMKIPCHHFSYVFIDESGQGTEPDMLIPISLVSANGKLHSQIVLAGDPQQLGPTVISKLATSILGRSILERLMAYDLYQKDCNSKYNPKYITKLLNNYRSHPDIIHVANQLFYDAELVAKCPTGRKNRGKNEKFPVIFHGIEGKEEKYSYSPSVCNWKEVRLVLNYIDDLLKNRLGFGAVTTEDIGIVTPFTLQSKKIKKALKDKKLKDINVGTVELFQGQERKVMIMTTVRSRTFVHEGKEHIGFLSNPKRFNVAITRSKKLLIIVGNPNVLQVDENWRYLLKFCMDNKSCKGLKFPLYNFSSDEKKENVSSDLVDSSSLFAKKSLSLYSGKEDLTDLMNSLHIFE